MQSEKPTFMNFGNPVRLGRAEVSSQNTAPAPASPLKKGSKTAGIFDTLLTLSLAALFFGVPLFFTGLTFQGVVFEKQIYFYFWILIGLVSWVSKGVLTGEMHIRRTPLDIPILLFLGFYILAAFFSVDRWHSFWGFFGDPSRGVISVAALVLTYYLLVSHFTPKRLMIFLGATLSSAILVGLWSLLVFLKVRFVPAAFEAFAPLSLVGTLSTLAIYFSLMVPLFITALFAVWNDGSLGKQMKSSLVGVLLFGLALSLYLILSLHPFLLDYKDSLSWLVPLGGLAFFLLYILAQIVRPPEQWTWVPMLTFVMILAFLMIGNIDLIRANLPVEVTPNMKLSTQVATASLKEHALFGVGPANYGYAFSLYHPEEYNQSPLYTLRFYQGTGLFFEALPTIGIIGTAFAVILWFSFLSVGLYLLSHEKQRNKVYSLGLWSTSVMLFIAAFTAPVNGTLLILGTLLASLALATLLWESGSEERYLSLSLKASPKFALALAFIFMLVSAGVAFLFVFMGKTFVADIAAGQAIRRSAQAPQTESLTLLNRAVRNYPQEGRYLTRFAQEYMALANVEAGKAEADRDVDRIIQYVQNAVALSEQGKRLMPNDVMATESLGLIYENSALYASDALPKAEENYLRALELEPNNPLLLVKLGQMKRAQADALDPEKDKEKRTLLYGEAETSIRMATEKKANLAVAYYNLSVVQARQRNFDAALENATKATQLDRNNVNYRYSLGVLHQLRGKDGDEDRAVAIFQDILKQNEKLVDVRLSLALLYEVQRKRDLAQKEYETVLGFMPENPEGNLKNTRDQIQKLLDNVKSGKGNIVRNGETPPVETQPSEVVAPALPPVPNEPNESQLQTPAE